MKISPKDCFFIGKMDALVKFCPGKNNALQPSRTLPTPGVEKPFNTGHLGDRH